MRFKPFHVYELDNKIQFVAGLPFTYFLCMTLPQKAASSVKHNIVGFPLLPGKARYGSDPLRMPIKGRGYGASQLEIAGEYFVAIDLLQPMNYDVFLGVERGQILESEKAELIDKLRSFLAI